VSFEEDFFGPGNRLRWLKIQSGTLPKDTRDKLSPFIEDMRGNPDVLVLPRVAETDNRTEWYVLCTSARFARAARDELRAFVGPSYSDLEPLNAADAVDAAVLARYGTSAFKLFLPDQELVNEARLRLRLMMDLRSEQPVRFSRQLRASGRVLRDFEYALIARDATAARSCIAELRNSGRLGATNALFMEVRTFAATEQWSSIFAMAEFDSLLAISRPRRVTEALLRAIYAIRLQALETQREPAMALQLFRDEYLPRYRDLLRSKAGLAGYEIDLAFLLASLANDPPDKRRAEAIASEYASDPRGAFLQELLRCVPPSKETSESPLQRAVNAFAGAEVDRAFVLAVALPVSFERVVLLLRCAREIGSVHSVTVALSAVDELAEAERERLERTAVLTKIYAELLQFRPRPELAVAAQVEAPDSPPASWFEWLNRLESGSRWRAAVAIAEVGSREWSFEDLAADSSAVSVLADALLIDRPDWGRTALRDTLPFLTEFLLARGPDARMKPVLESLFLSIAVDEQMSLPQFTVLTRVAEARIQLGLSVDEYSEVVAQLQRGLDLIASPIAAGAALEALDVLVASACPNPSARDGFIAYSTALFTRWYRRIDRSQWALLSRLGEELGVPVELPVAAEPESGASSSWDGLNGKRVALYSLRESALRRVELILRDMCPGIQVQVFADHVGGSPALRTAAGTADIFVVATAAAKHAATIFIDANRSKGRTTLYARGQGSASLLDALRAHLE
jgi:hypothetical protein